MYLKIIFALLLYTSLAEGKRKRCDQKPPQASNPEPSENKGTFTLSIETKGLKNLYLPDQTYVLTLRTNNNTRPFRFFMITAEDPNIDNTENDYEVFVKEVDVGSLKPLDTDKNSRYSERCFSSIENADNSDKFNIEVHWVSPKQTPEQNQNSESKQKVRIRAMVAENEEVWYTGGDLTIELEKNNNRSIDSPPFLPIAECTLCSEARYEVIFQGKWSRISHPRYYPSKPDDNGYSYMIGASHSFGYNLWRQGMEASPGLRKLAEEGNITLIEREIINNISATGGTRTLIRGKRRHHPHMFEPSHALFRVDRFHHLFSIAVAMRPSPDWFLGTSQFELCTANGWLKWSEIPMYPWDAGTVDGISYESPRSMTQPTGTIERVDVGSFDRKSPFYQMNLNDLRPFAMLRVNRLDVYPLVGVECNETGKTDDAATEENSNTDIGEEPKVSESRVPDPAVQNCIPIEWDEWSPCIVDQGSCGHGTQVRTRKYMDTVSVYNQDKMAVIPVEGSCEVPEQSQQIQDCYVDCDEK